MTFNKILIPTILVLTSVPLMAQAKFSMKHEVRQIERTITHDALNVNQLNRKCGVNNPKIACWTRFANKKHNAHAQYMLGKFFFKGIRVNRNRRKSANLYRKSAYQNNADAQMALAKMFQAGQGGLNRNKVNALAWYIVTIKNHGHNPNIVRKAKRLRSNLADTMGRNGRQKAKRLAGNLQSKIH